MAKQNYSPFHSLVQKLISTRLVAWFLSHTQHHLDRLFLKFSHGNTSLAAILTGLPLVTLNCTGAKSGLPRSVPLLGIPDEEEPGRLALIASNWGRKNYPAWYHNLKANPRATITVRQTTAEYIVHEAGGEEYNRFWQYAQDIYAGYPNYKERVGQRGVPIMVLTPV